MPATPTLTVTNNANGTATVAISGSTAGATNSVLVVAVDSQWGDNIAWQTAGSRTGDGSVTVSLAKGVYFFTVSSTLSGQTAVAVPKPSPVSSGTVVLPAILDAVQARIRLLNLVPSDRVFSHTVIDESFARNLAGGPAIIVGPANENISVIVDATSVLQRDDIGYPIVAAYVAPANGSQKPTDRDGFFGPSQAIRRAFQSQGLAVAGATVFYCDTRPLRPAEREWWEKLAFVSANVLVFRSREARGLGA